METMIVEITQMRKSSIAVPELAHPIHSGALTIDASLPLGIVMVTETVKEEKMNQLIK